MKNDNTSFQNFTFFGDYLANIQDLPREEQDEIILAIVRYTAVGETPKFSKKYLQTVFNCIKFSLDKSRSAANRGQGRHPNVNQEENKTESKENQSEIKPESNQNQNEIKKESNENQTPTNENKNKNIEQERESKTHARFSSLADIGEAEILQVAGQYQVKPAFVRNCLDDLKNYCASKGKTYKNYLAALRNFVKGDLNKGAKNASQLATPTLFGKPSDNPDLARQSQTQRQTKPLSQKDLDALRDSLPPPLRQKILARQKAQTDGKEHNA